MKFQTPYDLDPTVPEKGGGKKLTDTSGYVPHNIRIQEIINAGQRLNDWRDSQNYDFWEKDDDGKYFDPTRSKNYTYFDAVDDNKKAIASLKKQQKEYDKAQADLIKQKEAEKVSMQGSSLDVNLAK